MERALLQGEVTAQLEKIQQDEKWLQQLQVKEDRLGKELDAFRSQEGFKIQSSKAKMESIERDLDRFFTIFFFFCYLQSERRKKKQKKIESPWPHRLRKGQDKTRQDKTGQDRTRQDKTGQADRHAYLLHGLAAQSFRRR